jgi:hypothetical protein
MYTLHASKHTSHPLTSLGAIFIWSGYSLVYIHRNLSPTTSKQHRNEIYYAQLAEIVNFGRGAGLHKLPVKLLLDVAEYLAREDREALGRTCRWVRYALGEKGYGESGWA